MGSREWDTADRVKEGQNIEYRIKNIEDAPDF
jgi:hypothetical protein